MKKKKNKKIKKAMEIIDEMSMDEKEWELYESRRLAIMDYNTGINESKEEGIKEGKIEVAKELFKLGLNIDDIQKVTKLTKDEIQNL